MQPPEVVAQNGNPPSYVKNPERELDCVVEMFGRFQHSGITLYPVQRRMYEHLGELLKGKRVLEIGCGTGVGTNIMAVLGAMVVGSDVSPKHVTFAAQLYPNISFVQWDIKRGACEPQVAAVVAVEVIEHIEDVEIAIFNMIKSASETFYFSSPNRANAKLGQNKPINDFHVQEFTPAEVLELGPLKDFKVTILDPWSFEEVSVGTTITPLVYKVDLK